MTVINSKTLSRIAAMQAVYQIESNLDKEDIDNIKTSIIEYYDSKMAKEDLYEDISKNNIKQNSHPHTEETFDKKNINKTHNEYKDSLIIKLNKNFFSKVFDKVVVNLDKIDQNIQLNISRANTFSSLSRSTIAVLRCGCAELMFLTEVPPNVVVNEYTNIASDMLKDNEIGFVNSILDLTKASYRPKDDIAK